MKAFGRLVSVVIAVVMLIAVKNVCAQTRPTAATKPSTQPILKLDVLKSGEIRVSMGDRLLANGHWSLYHDFRGPDRNEIAIGELVTSSAEQDGPTHAVVHDTYANARTTTEIILDGEDLRLRVRVENLDPTKAMSDLAFHGFTFHFARNASGTMPSWHDSYLSGEGYKIFHPGLAEPVGAVTAHDDQFGFGVHSASEFNQMSLFTAQWQKDGLIPAECQINFHTTETAPPGHAVDIDANFRISADMSLRHLLEDYKKTYTRHFPALLYHADSRPVSQFATVGKNLVAFDNPLGFGGPVRRLDSAVGTAAYVRAQAPVLQNAGALGIIFWGLGGYSEPMYPPDFDVFPESVRENIPALVDGFKKHGLRVGLCARCGDGVTRKPAKQFEMYRLNADDPEQMKTLLDRFDHAIQLGFDLFYLDSFGVENPNDQKILEKIRERVGPDVLLYSEFCTDMSLPYAGHYCEWRGTYILWTTDDQYAAFRYLCPDSTWLAISRTGRAVPPEFAKLGLTPLVEDASAGWLPASRPSK